MSDYNWCHGPKCHTNHTVDRVRGVKGSKVLRTRKIKLNKWNENHFFRFFCSNTCYDNFASKYIEQIIAIAPRTECLETPIEDPKKEKPYENANWYNWEIKVDNTRTNDVG